MAADIEEFIAEQKAKISQERRVLDTENLDDNKTGPRRQWDTTNRGASAILDEYAARYGSNFVDDSKPSKRVPDRNERNERAPPVDDRQRAPPVDERRGRTPEDGGRLNVGQSNSVNDRQKRLREDRHREYNELLQQKEQASQRGQPGNRAAGRESREGVLPLGKYEEKRKNLNKERQREYNEMLNKTRAPSKRVPPPVASSGDSVLPLGKYQQDRKKLLEERNREYNDILSQKPTKSPNHQGNDSKPDTPLGQTRRPDRGQKENIPPFIEDDEEVGFGAKLGGYEEKRKRLNEERKKEYNSLLAQKNVRSQGNIAGADDYVATLPGLKDGAPPPQADDPPRAAPSRRRRRDEDEDFGTSLPLRDRASAERVVFDGLEEEDELYSRYLRERPPRRGWATPTYEEILDKKRREERQYRKYDTLGYMRASRSDGHLNRNEDDLRKFRDLDREFESKKVRFREDQEHTRPNYVPIGLDPENEFTQWLTQLRLKYGNPLQYPEDSTGPANPSVPQKRSRIKATPITVVSDLLDDENHYDSELDRVQHELKNQPRKAGGKPQLSRRGAQNQDTGGATLAIGREVTASADQRKKAAYRQELERQMKQSQQNKQKEKAEDMRVNATGANDVFRNPSRQTINPSRAAAPRNQPSRLLEDDFSPRSIIFSDANKTRSVKAPGILETGFQGLYPSVLNKSPSRSGSVLAAGGNPQLQAYNTPLDDAYNYYGQVNPLDADQETPRVTFAQNSKAPPGAREPDPVTGEVNPFPSDETRSKSRSEAKNSYKQELLRQIEEDKRKKQKVKEEKERYDRKLEEEIRNYNPYGRGGGGAPMKDDEGNIMADRKQILSMRNDVNQNADLRKMRRDNDETELTGRKSKEYRAPLSDRFSPPPPAAPPQQSFRSNGEQPDYKRGGNGIFGDGLTEGQKKNRNKYQEDLAKQIEEKKRQQAIEKEKIKQEEEKLLQKIEEDKRKIQEEYENDRKKEREKAEAADRQQQEIKRQQEEKRKEAERRRQEEDEDRQKELRRQEDERRRERQNPRTRSPPVPALRTKSEQDTKRVQSRASSNRSPPLPASRTQSRQSRAPSTDVLNQLAKMKAQLQSESRRVEQDLKKEQNEPEVYDARLYQKPITPVRHNVDVFEVARHREPAQVKRTADDRADGDNLKEFRELKKGQSQSRNDLRNMFPNTPTTSDNLEAQQRVLLDLQEQDKPQKGGFDRKMPNMDPKSMGLFREKSTASANLLDSDSAFIGVPDSNGYPEDFDNLPRYKSRNESARSRRRDQRNLETPASYRHPPSSQSNYNPMGSVLSLDPDEINRRNEDRLKKLKSFGDEVSTGDPDDILGRFMAKQQHYSRPPSGHTLQDESWLRPGTRYDR